MKLSYVNVLMVAALAGGILFSSCRSAREATARYELSKS